MSQPALTLNIRQFEEMVGVPLLIRTTRTVSLTPAGKSLLGHVEMLMGGFEKAVRDLRADALCEDNQLAVAVLPSVAIRLLPGVMSEFTQLHPSVTLQLRDDNGRGVHAQVLNGDADFGICNRWEHRKGLEFTPLMRDQIGLVCRASHCLAKIKKPLCWADLAPYPFVGMADDTGVGRLMQSFEGLPGSIQSPANSVLTIAALVGLLESGENISALPALAAPDYLNPSLVYRDLSDPLLHRELCLVTATDRSLSPAARTFFDFLMSKRKEVSGQFPNSTVTAV